MTVAIMYFIYGFMVGFIFRPSVNGWLKRKYLEDETNVNYIAKGNLNKSCWVRSLRMLEKIERDKQVTGACMRFGHLNGGGHAWIAYQKTVDGVTTNYSYDPTTDKSIKCRQIRRKK